ncbi:CNBP [Mytilus edulis]|uniref:CNBP n=1 Tax=Mytilus edulis TaxID=6550 RepID=A0A8S3T9H3_MYTED|nr:CNBP [Mytilus edulis]
MNRERLRYKDLNTNCQTGDRIIICLKFENPLPRFLKIGKYAANIIHYGQPRNNQKIICRKCLEEGHIAGECTNDWKCEGCGKSGHKQDACTEGLVTEDEQDNTESSNSEEEKENETLKAQTGDVEENQKAIQNLSDTEFVNPYQSIHRETQNTPKDNIESCIEIPTSRTKCKQTAFLLSIRVNTRMASNIGRRHDLADDFIDDSAFEEKVQEQNQEAIKWKDLPTGVIYKIIEELEVDGKYEKKCKILTLRDKEGIPLELGLALRFAKRRVHW